MKNNKCPVNELISFLEKRSVSEIELEPNPALKKHIDICKDCKELVDNNRLGEIFLKANSFAEEINSVLKRSVSISAKNASNLKVGQLCRFKYGENNKKFALTVSNVFKSGSDLIDAVRVMPIFPNPNYFDYSEVSDFVISEKENPLGLPILIEWWNERPILIAQIDTTYGSLSKEQLDKVMWYASGKSDSEELTKNQQLFRIHEIEIGKLYSESVFDEVLKNKPVITMDFSPMVSSNEPIPLAATSSEDNVKFLYKKIADYIFDNEPEIKLQKIDNQTFCLENYVGKEIKIVIILKDGKEILFNADNDNKIIIHVGNCPDVSNISKVKIFCI